MTITCSVCKAPLLFDPHGQLKVKTELGSTVIIHGVPTESCACQPSPRRLTPQPIKEKAPNAVMERITKVCAVCESEYPGCEGRGNGAGCCSSACRNRLHWLRKKGEAPTLNEGVTP